MPDIDVLIVNFLTPDLVVGLVDRIAGEGIHIYVWDNSGDIPPGRLGPDVEVHGDGRNLFYAEASNRLYAMSDSPLVALVNPDIELDVAELRRMADALLGDEARWGVAPRLVDPGGQDQAYVRRLPTLSRVVADRVKLARRWLRAAHDSYWYADLARDRDGDVEQPAAACLMLRRAAVGPSLFDPSYRLFFNDTDLARRLGMRGTCRYLGSMSVVHRGGESIARLQARRWIRIEYDRSYLRYCRRNLRSWPLLVPIFVARIGLTKLIAAVAR